MTNPAVRAEPAGIGTSRARDPLSREVKLLGSLLGQVIAEQAGEDLLHLVERVRRLTMDIRSTGSLSRQRCLRDILEDSGRRAGRGPHQGLQPLLPPDQPGRGEAARPPRAQACPDGQRRGPGGLHRGSRAPTPARGRAAAQPGAHRRPLRSASCSRRTPRRRGDARCSWRCGVSSVSSTGSTTSASRPTRTPRSGAGCARRSRSCGAPPRCAWSAPRPWTRCATRSSSSTSRSSWSRRVSIGRSTEPWTARPGSRTSTPAPSAAPPPPTVAARGLARRPRMPSCAGAPGWAPTATDTRA